MPDWWEGFKVGQLVEDKPPENFPKSHALIIRLCPENGIGRAHVEVQWLATGAPSLQFVDVIKRVEQ